MDTSLPRSCPHCKRALSRTSQEYSVSLDCIISQESCEVCHRKYVSREVRRRPLWLHIRQSASFSNLSKESDRQEADVESVQNQ